MSIEAKKEAGVEKVATKAKGAGATKVSTKTVAAKTKKGTTTTKSSVKTDAKAGAKTTEKKTKTVAKPAAKTAAKPKGESKSAVKTITAEKLKENGKENLKKIKEKAEEARAKGVKESLKLFGFVKESKIYNWICNFVKSLADYLKDSFNKSKEGEENLTKMLWIWCLTPSIIFMVLQAKMDRRPVLPFALFNILFLAILVMALYFISKALKVHPEYNRYKTEKKAVKEYEKTLNVEELKKFKAEQHKESAKKTMKKLFAMEPWGHTEFYTIVKLFVVLNLLIVLNNILRCF